MTENESPWMRAREAAVRVKTSRKRFDRTMVGDLRPRTVEMLAVLPRPAGNAL